MTPEGTEQDFETLAMLPIDRPVSFAYVMDLGISRRQLARLVETGLVRRPFKGVYLSVAVPDTLGTRLDVLRLVVPADCVVTDRTAGWVWAGERALAPNDHLQLPTLSVFCRPGHRLRSGLTHSGERRFRDADIVEVDGLVLTTPLRTACDLGRLLSRDQAWAALDTMAATGHFSVDELILEAQRFRGYRGVVQLRDFAFLVDPRSQSQGESILRLRWYDAGLPTPECQIEVPGPWGGSFFLDIGHVGLKLAAEYDGARFHGADAREHDESRRAWITDCEGWQIVVARRENIYGPTEDIHGLLWNAWQLARRRADRPA